MINSSIAPSVGSSHTLFDERSEWLIVRFAILYLFASILHQAIFCFLNTHVMQISKGTLVAFEGGLMLVSSMLFILRPRPKMLILLLFIIANSLILSMFQKYFDPKQIRNFFIPIVAIWLGSQCSGRISADRTVKYIAFMVIGFGLFEAFFSELYQSLFNVRRFQIAIGRGNERSLEVMTGTLSLNGMRYAGRNMLGSILGNHRISSVFLETVSMGNFGVLIACWGLSKTQIRKLLIYLAMGLMIAVMADSRFATSIILVLILFRMLLPLPILKMASLMMPLVIIVTCLIVYISSYNGMTDDLKGRVGLTGYYLCHFSVPEFFGASNAYYSGFVDSGYPYLFHFNGLILALIVWLSLAFIKTGSQEGARFKAFVMVFVAALLAISGDGVYALKISGMMWFMVGLHLLLPGSNRDDLMITGVPTGDSAKPNFASTSKRILI